VASIVQPCDAGVILAGPPPAFFPAAARRWVLVATVLGSSLAFIDGTVVNLALPALQSELGAGVADMQWVIEAYALVLATLLLVGGVLGDRYGRRRVYAAGIALFAAASLACGCARSIHELIVLRAVQGIGAALLVPGSLTLISASFPRSERGRAIGTWSGFSSMTMASGPIVGGWLIDHLSWRWAFFLNLPIALVVLALLYWRVPESRDPDAPRRLDWRGALLVTSGLAAVVYALIDSPFRGWLDPRVMGCLALGIIALGGFVAAEARGEAPMLPLELFRSSDFSGANALTFLLYGALSAAFFFLPLDLIQVHGYSSTAAGAAFLPFVVVVSLFSRWSGGLMDRFGGRLPLVVGPIVAAFGFALIAVPGVSGGYWVTFFPGILVLGIGMAASVAPLTTTVMNAVDVDRSGAASGINNAVARLAGVLSVAVLSIVVVHTFSRSVDIQLDALDVSPALRETVRAEYVKLAGAGIPSGSDVRQREAIRRIIAESFVRSFRTMLSIAALLAVASSVLAALTIGARSPDTRADP